MSRLQRYIRFGLIYTIIPIVFPILILANRKMSWTGLWNLLQVVWEATKDPIPQRVDYFQNLTLLHKLYHQERSAKVYLDHHALEWQTMEGYCGRATMRCVLASFGMPSELLPPQIRGAMGPEKFVELIQELKTQNKGTPNDDSDNDNSNDKKKDNDETKPLPKMTLTTTTTTTTNMILPKIETEIVRGDCSYEVFLQTIRRVHNDNERVVLNFLRPALFGLQRPLWWLPTHLMFGLFGGHFSPVIGVLEEEEHSETNTNTMTTDDATTTTTTTTTKKKNINDNPLVAVFDVNHKYGGAYLVPARRLYQSVQAKDAMSGQSRALVVLTNKID
jgi:hypothetical protein